jgi:thioester reductase-like protein
MRVATEFCATAQRRPRLTFVSICAVGDWPLVNPENPVIPEGVILDWHSAMPHGYGESKYVAERMLANANSTLGIPANIIRAGQIGGPSAPNMGFWPRQGWLLAIIKASQATGAFPEHVQPLDWIPVDDLADAIAKSTIRRRMPSTVEVFNLVHPKPASWRLLLETLQLGFGLDATEVSLQTWLSRFDPSAFKLYGFLRATGGGREYNIAFRSTRAQEILPEVQAITRNLLQTWLAGWGISRRATHTKL